MRNCLELLLLLIIFVQPQHLGNPIMDNVKVMVLHDHLLPIHYLIKVLPRQQSLLIRYLLDPSLRHLIKGGFTAASLEHVLNFVPLVYILLRVAQQ